MGDFTGFSFGNWHSTDPTTGVVNVIRVSGGDRYDEELHPEIKDKTAEVPGLNGEYYFGSDFGTKSFDIEIAFDHLTEEQFRELRRTFGIKQIKQLIFNERPYKYYMAKLESPIELSYVCFDEPLRVETTIEGIPYKENGIESTSHIVMRPDEQGRTQRIYKGEGKISFICYFPFAKSVYKQLPAGEEEESDWAISSGILNSEDYATVDNYNNEVITVYNPGDLPTGFRLYLPANVINTDISLIYKINPSLSIADALLVLNAITLKDGDNGVMIDTNSGLIIGVSTVPTLDPITGMWSYTTSGNLYNEYINSGYFFKIEPNLNRYDRSILQIDGGSEGILIFYDYLYF